MSSEATEHEVELRVKSPARQTPAKSPDKSVHKALALDDIRSNRRSTKISKELSKCHCKRNINFRRSVVFHEFCFMTVTRVTMGHWLLVTGLSKYIRS